MEAWRRALVIDWSIPSLDQKLNRRIGSGKQANWLSHSRVPFQSEIIVADDVPHHDLDRLDCKITAWTALHAVAKGYVIWTRRSRLFK